MKANVLNCEPAEEAGVIRSIARYTAMTAQRPTTMQLVGSGSNGVYYTLRKRLASLLKREMLQRHANDRWSWSVTDKGWQFAETWRSR